MEPANNNNVRNLVAGAVALIATSSAFAEAPAEITTAVTDMTAGFTAIKGLVVTVVLFGIVVGYMKLLRKK